MVVLNGLCLRNITVHLDEYLSVNWSLWDDVLTDSTIVPFRRSTVHELLGPWLQRHVGNKRLEISVDGFLFIDFSSPGKSVYSIFPT